MSHPNVTIATMDVEMVWREGDPWRDLTAEVVGLAAATVVSQSGTTRLLDLAQGRHDRFPLDGGHAMWLDRVWRPLECITVTPCGLNILGSLDWAAGTPIRLVLAGLVPDWAATAVGQATLAAIERGGLPAVGEGHPVERCGALYCTIGD